MDEAELYLDHAASVEVYGRPVKADDVQNLLRRIASVPGTWTTRQLNNMNTFFVACPSREVVHHLMTGGRIKGNGFYLQVNHWNLLNGSIPHYGKLKVSASLFNLPLTCWNSQAMKIIVSSIG